MIAHKSSSGYGRFIAHESIIVAMKLEIESGGKRWTVGLPQGALFLRVGSGADCEVRIPDASSLHAKIENFMGKWSVTDQMSDTGTKLNGETAYSSEIKPGDVIEIGGAKIRILAGEAATPKAAPAPRQALFEPPTGLSFKVESMAPLVGTPDSLSPTGKVETMAPQPLHLEGRATLRESAAAKPARHAAAPATPTTYKPYPMSSPAGMAPAQTSGRKPAPALVLVIFVGFFVFFFGSVAWAVFNDINQAPPPPDWPEGDDPFANIGRPAAKAPATKPAVAPQKSPGNAASRPASTRLAADLEASYRKRILDIEKSQEAPEVRLAALDSLIEELKDWQHGLGWDLERTRRNLDIALLNEMSKRYNDDSGAVYDLVRAKEFAAALKRLEDLRAYAQKTAYHKALQKISGIAEYVEPKIEEVEALNSEFITSQFIEADRFLALNNFKGARDAVAGLLAKARVESLLRVCAEQEVVQLQTFITEQEAGKRDAAKPPFDKRKWKLPPAPKSSLLPEGEASRSRFTSALTTRLSKAARAGELMGTLAVMHGRQAVIGAWKGYRLELEIQRPMSDDIGEIHTFRFKVLRQTSDLPAATQLSIFEQFQEPTRDEFLGMLLYCYDNGLMDDAPRIACKLWKADPTVKDDLDKLMAAKLGIEVPAGGFVEREGRLVAP